MLVFDFERRRCGGYAYHSLQKRKEIFLSAVACSGAASVSMYSVMFAVLCGVVVVDLEWRKRFLVLRERARQGGLRFHGCLPSSARAPTRNVTKGPASQPASQQ